jgi:hypothetical protein
MAVKAGPDSAAIRSPGGANSASACDMVCNDSGSIPSLALIQRAWGEIAEASGAKLSRRKREESPPRPLRHHKVSRRVLPPSGFKEEAERLGGKLDSRTPRARQGVVMGA